MTNEIEETHPLEGVAIIGMAGRFPKAADIDEYWQNLINGKECITFYTDEELINAGISPEVIKNPNYIKAKGEVDNVDMFDAAFFGINPREAEVTDPQHRMLLECAWEAMENAGYDSGKFDGPIGIFAGKSMDYYLLLNVYPKIKKEISAGSLQAAIGNDKDSLTTTISYRLNLTGPGISVQTSSSTSLVAICVACQSILTYQCDMALAGGVTSGPPIKSGYLYEEGNIWSVDGHCRAFDHRASGFVPAAGMGLVVLKRLEDAVADGDHIWAVIKGFAVNNDGNKKVSYSAPSVDAQAEVVAQALAVADAHPETIQYIETHGTGTHLGDPIEIAALTQAFGSQTDKKQFCAIGSVKSNIGHLDNAAGVAGLIKATMALKYRKIPASLHFEKANPKIDFDNSPFYVNTQLKEWEPNINDLPRRAGVTSLGMGGTNAHVVLEEFDKGELFEKSSPLTPAKIFGLGSFGLGDSGLGSFGLGGTGLGLGYLMNLSAKTITALDQMTDNLATFLKKNPDVRMIDVAHTLAVGRRDLNVRRIVVGEDRENIITALETRTPGRVLDTMCESLNTPVVLMFSGQGAQYINMAKELYSNQPVFREAMDQCAEILRPIMDMDCRSLIYPKEGADSNEMASTLNRTQMTQPALFMIEYSLAKMWMHWGINPVGMIGHSIGEYTAACISGCMSLEDALMLVAVRGRLMQSCNPGTMLSIVGPNENEIMDMLSSDLSLAAVNSPKHCVVSGTTEAVEKLEQQLTEKNIFYKRLHTSHAFHSAMMDPILTAFEETVAKVKLSNPMIPFISSVSGSWITNEDARNPQYWAQQLRNPVRFAEGIDTILNDPGRLLLEVGPGNSLCVLAEQKTKKVFPSVRHIKQNEPDSIFLLKTLGNLWMSGVSLDWKRFYQDENPRRIPLPTYPFERKRYWMAEAGTEPGKDIDHVENEIKENVTSRDDHKSKTFQPRPKLNTEYVEPSTDMERRIVGIWEDILGIQPIGTRDNFFDLGGHSLLATLFLSRLQEETGIRLELKIIFETPFIEAIAQLAVEAQSSSGDMNDIEALVKEIEGLSPEELQQALAEEEKSR
ncbi:MAG: beta-ketoacyl synthase N-terminal-like domain-containing protein [Candidatus Omnitrophota bacterium]